MQLIRVRAPPSLCIPPPEVVEFPVKVQLTARTLEELGVETLFVEPGSPWENGYVESFNSRMRDELLNGELFLHIDEMKYVVERWRMDYNHYRPHSSLGYMTPAGFAQLCQQAGCVRPHTPVLDGVQDCGILS